MRELWNYVFHFQINDNEHATGVWISPEYALTAAHTVDSLNDQQKQEAFAIWMDYKTVRGCKVKCQIVKGSYHRDWDLMVLQVEIKALVELLQANPNEPKPEIEFMEVNYVNIPDDGWWYGRTLSIYGFSAAGGGFVRRPFSKRDLSLPDREKESLKKEQSLNGTDVAWVRVHVANEQKRINQIGGLSGAPLFAQELEQVIGILVEYNNGKHNFHCVETAHLRKWWTPLDRAVNAYEKGEELLKQREWKKAEEKLKAAEKCFKEDVRLSVPNVLEKIIAIAEAQQLLDKEEWDKALKRVDE